MEATKNKKYKTFDYLTRYNSVPEYFNTNDNRWVCGLTSHIDKSIGYKIIEVYKGDTIDSVAERVYGGHSEYWWILADFNDILDPFIPNFSEKYKTLKVIPYTKVKYIN